MQIRFLETSSRRLLTSFHDSSRLRARSAAVLLCNPFGEEAARAHRSFRVLATRLESAGFATLRFDYAGTGDSEGEIDQFGVEDWLDDIVSCADALRERSNASRLVLVGLRLGATLAALATTRRQLRPRHLVLWDPVIDGEGGLAELAQAHHDYLREELGDAAPRGERRVAGDRGPDEVLGMPMSTRLTEQLRAIDLRRETPQVDHLTIVGSRPSAALAGLQQQLPASPGVRWIDTGSAGSWDSDAALNAAVVPMEDILAIVTRIEELSP